MAKKHLNVKFKKEEKNNNSDPIVLDIDLALDSLSRTAIPLIKFQDEDLKQDIVDDFISMFNKRIETLRTISEANRHTVTVAVQFDPGSLQHIESLIYQAPHPLVPFSLKEIQGE